jgi:hypothetical protein
LIWEVESNEPVGVIVYGYVSEEQRAYTNGAGLGCALGLRTEAAGTAQ